MHTYGFASIVRQMRWLNTGPGVRCICILSHKNYVRLHSLTSLPNTRLSTSRCAFNNIYFDLYMFPFKMLFHFAWHLMNSYEYQYSFQQTNCFSCLVLLLGFLKRKKICRSLKALRIYDTTQCYVETECKTKRTPTIRWGIDIYPHGPKKLHIRGFGLR